MDWAAPPFLHVMQCDACQCREALVERVPCRAPELIQVGVRPGEDMCFEQCIQGCFLPAVGEPGGSPEEQADVIFGFGILALQADPMVCQQIAQGLGRFSEQGLFFLQVDRAPRGRLKRVRTDEEALILFDQRLPGGVAFECLAHGVFDLTQIFAAAQGPGGGQFTVLAITDGGDCVRMVGRVIKKNAKNPAAGCDVLGRQFVEEGGGRHARCPR